MFVIVLEYIPYSTLHKMICLLFSVCMALSLLEEYFTDANDFACSEVAFGYKGLQIQLFYTAGNLGTLFKVKYSSKVTEVFDCVEVRCALFYSFHVEVVAPLNVTGTAVLIICHYKQTMP